MNEQEGPQNAEYAPESVMTLWGSVRHLVDPHQRQPPWHPDGGVQVTACKRRYWVVWDAQHDRPLCEMCRRWLVAHRDGSGASS